MNQKNSNSKGFVPRLVVPRESINKTTSKVGKAAYDILSKEQSNQTVEETIQEMTNQYFDELLIAVKRGIKDFVSPFYVVVSRKKETLAGNTSNILFHKYTTRQTKPRARFLRDEFPHYDHDVYEINSNDSSINLLFTLPTFQDSLTILKNRHLYDPQLVKWIEDYNSNLLDQD